MEFTVSKRLWDGGHYWTGTCGCVIGQNVSPKHQAMLIHEMSMDRIWQDTMLPWLTDALRGALSVTSDYPNWEDRLEEMLADILKEFGHTLVVVD